jgi:AcrR family transcriptional regulator
MARSGRRPGASGTREAILDAARDSFAEQGFDATTIRGVARGAGVDAALVHHYFGTKDDLFVAAMELPVNPKEVLSRVLSGPREDLGERIVRAFLAVWDEGPARRPLIALVRSAASNERAAATVRQFLQRVVLRRVVAALGTPDAALRASLVGAQMIGLAMARYVLRIEPLASGDHETVVAALAPNVQRLLTGDLSGTPPAGALSPVPQVAAPPPPRQA